MDNDFNQPVAAQPFRLEQRMHLRFSRYEREKSLGFLRNFPWQIRPNFETIKIVSPIESLPSGFLIFLSIRGLFEWPTKNEWR